MGKKYCFRINCIDSDGGSIRDMVENARDVTYETMLKHCADLLEKAESLGYCIRGKDLKLKDDFTVSFHKSKYRGKPCYYFLWSSIEYIFTTKETRTC